jgi:hypothetical protein
MTPTPELARLTEDLRSPDPAVRDEAAVRGWLAAFLDWYAAEPDTRGHDDRVAYAVKAVLQRDLVDHAEVRRQVDRLAARYPFLGSPS